ncbi:Cytochrome P450 [Halopseudomonas litoralis]|uniref:Cytochrome P450 n=1 Tax=Halopseudomonas litoralis TaxID=797277 RepID=A0A1H1W1B6_9GAMM|nr:cytochrome P450 [Halopseudomonas litoralis]SDS90833.1 Cytochrome P450 [Halopseudomonas litoralis]
MSTDSVTNATPSHVPAHLVQNFDLWGALTAQGENAYAWAAKLHESMPPIFWVPSLGFLPGTWIPRRSEDLRRILQDPETFSSAGLTPYPMLLGESWRLAPLEVDPPDHAKYRALLNPLFTPKKVNALEQDIRQLATQLIDGIAQTGRCDFNEDFAKPFPTLIFLKLMGWPLEHRPLFQHWTQTLIKSSDSQVVTDNAHEITGWIRARIAECRTNPGDDFTSYLLASQIDGRPLTDDEMLGINFLIFIGGLDTVTSTIGLFFRHLARNPEQQAQLRTDPTLIPDAVEEMLRSYSIVNMRRTVTRDVQIGEATMKKGDIVLISTELANLDPEVFDQPEKVDFLRSAGHTPHMAFSYGVHRCVGSHLARRELRIALELWLTKVPPFRIATGTKPRFNAFGIFGMEELHLEWDVKEAK